MRATNLEDPDSPPAQDWASVTAILDAGLDVSSSTGRYTTWITTINPDGSPQVTSVGAVWVDGAFWFQTGVPTRKAMNLATDPRCALSIATKGCDLVINGTAEKVNDPAAVARVVAAWVSGGWPVEVDASGFGLTAPFNAPGLGPPPWFVYRITPRSATSVATVEGGGATRWTF